LVRQWTKKPFLCLPLHPLPPIRLVVVAVSQERGSRKLVVEVVVASLLLSPSEHRHRLERDAVALEAIVVVLVATVVFVAPKATGLVLDVAFGFHALITAKRNARVIKRTNLRQMKCHTE